MINAWRDERNVTFPLRDFRGDRPLLMDRIYAAEFVKSQKWTFYIAQRDEGYEVLCPDIEIGTSGTTLEQAINRMLDALAGTGAFVRESEVK